MPTNDNESIFLRRYCLDISNARTPQDLKQSLISLRRLIQTQHTKHPKKEEKNSDESQQARAAERLLTWQLTTISRQIEERQKQKEDSSALQSILSVILDCLGALWNLSGCFALANRQKFRELLRCLVRTWALLLPPEDDHINDISYCLGQSQQETLLLLMQSFSILCKQRELQHDVIRSGIVPLVIRTSEKLNVVDATNSPENKPKLLQSVSWNLIEHEDEKKCEDTPIATSFSFPTFASLTCSAALLEELVHLIQQLTNRTDGPDQLFLYKQLLPVILGCCSHGDDSNKRPVALLEAVTAILWNWATSITDLSHLMCADSTVWKQLRLLWGDWNGTEKDKNTLQRNVSAIIGTMIANCCRDGSSSTLQHQTESKGCDTGIEQPIATIVQQSWTLPIVLRVIGTCDIDIGYRRRCMRIVRCLANRTWGRAFLLQKSDLLEVSLLEVLRMQHARIDNETRTLACQSATDLLPTMKPQLDSASGLLGPFLDTALIELVERVEESPDPRLSGELVMSAIQTLSVSLQYSQWQRSASCFSETFFEVVMMALQEQIDQPAFHASVSGFLLHLLEREETISIDESTSTSTQIRGITELLANTPTVLEILTMLLSATSNPAFDMSRQNAVEVIRALLDDDMRNKKALAADEYLLTALVNFCLMNHSQGSPIKAAAKEIILVLVREL